MVKQNNAVQNETGRFSERWKGFKAANGKCIIQLCAHFFRATFIILSHQHQPPTTSEIDQKRSKIKNQAAEKTE
jgi:hypothetical protein